MYPGVATCRPEQNKLVPAAGSAEADPTGNFRLEICRNLRCPFFLCGKSRSGAGNIMKRSDFFYATGLRAVLYCADSRSVLPFIGIRSASGLRIQASTKSAADPETGNGQRDLQISFPDLFWTLSGLFGLILPRLSVHQAGTKFARLDRTPGRNKTSLFPRPGVQKRGERGIAPCTGIPAVVY